MIDSLVAATNQMLRQLHDAPPQEISPLAHERQQVDRELSNLVAFVTKGEVSSPRLRDEIRAREQRLAELDHQLDRLRAPTGPTPPPLQAPGRGSCPACTRSGPSWRAPPRARGGRSRSTSRISASRPPLTSGR